MSVQGSSGTHADITEIVDLYRSRITGGTIFLRPAVPPEKITAAISAYASGVRPEDVVALVDDTAVGSAEQGGLLTATHLYAGGAQTGSRQIRLAEIGTVDCREGMVDVDGQPFLPMGFSSVSDSEAFGEMLTRITAAVPRPAAAAKAAEVSDVGTVPVVPTPAVGSRIDLELSHLMRAEWHSTGLTRESSTSYLTFPISVHRPAQGRSKERHWCPQCQREFQIVIYSDALRRRNAKLGALAVLVGGAVFAVVLSLLDTVVERGGVLFWVGLMVAPLVAMAGAATVWVSWPWSDSRGVTLGAVGKDSGKSGRFVEHSLALKQ